MNINGGLVLKVPLSGGNPLSLASGLAAPRDIAIDATSVYWVNETGGTVMKIVKAP
jgi:hypothetical protein